MNGGIRSAIPPYEIYEIRAERRAATACYGAPVMPEAEEAKPQPWTLGAIRAHGMKLEAACLAASCRAFVVYDLDALIESLGADCPLPESGLGHECPHCGGDMTFQLAVWHPTDKAEA